MSPLKKAAFCLVFLSWLIWPLSAQIIKMGTLVPGGSPWDQNLRILAADWDRITNGKVQLKIYAGGRAGDESDMLRKMRFNQLQAVGLSIGGLSQVYGGVLAPAIPMLVETEDELMYLLEKLMSVFLVEFEKKGFKILFWNLAGWAHFFSREPIVYPADLKKQKMWIMEGNTEEYNTWKKLGFQAVTFTTMDMLIQLQSGGVDAFVTSPLVAASNQWFGVANDMTSLRWAPFYGAFLISTKVWDRIPSAFYAGLQEAADRCAVRMNKETQKADAEALEVMQKYGLVINKTTDNARAEWARFVQTALEEFVGGKFDISYYHQAKEYLDEYRKSHRR